MIRIGIEICAIAIATLLARLAPVVTAITVLLVLVEVEALPVAILEAVLALAFARRAFGVVAAVLVLVAGLADLLAGGGYWRGTERGRGDHAGEQPGHERAAGKAGGEQSRQAVDSVAIHRVTSIQPVATASGGFRPVAKSQD
ncbi:MAG: hypothetical protein M3464_14750 [Chloroflexota bacterium]|nr:hypothetical protein [Chloroflexota bacterium]